MSDDDRERWNDRYSGLGPASVDDIALPAVFEPYAHLFPTTGHALEIACGRGQTAIWLALRGLHVVGVDVSAVAVDQATELAAAAGAARRCRFEVVDLDDGLPAGPPANTVVCQRYRDPRLDTALLARLAEDGLLAICALSEVGATPGRFRVQPGELRQAFGALDVIAADEADGLAWLVGRKPPVTARRPRG